MKILCAHNYYQQPGGEDESFAAEIALLESHGHQVVRYCVHNDAIEGRSRWSVAADTVWSRGSYRALQQLIVRERPDIAHFNNTFPLVSPAAYYAARALGVPVVQSLRNYRLLCPGAFFHRDGRVCQDCVGKRIAYPAIWHRCYRDSRAGSAVVTAMLATHGALKTWHRAVDVFVALTEFGRRQFVAGGLPEEKLVVKPNFLATDPGVGAGRGDDVLFVGRLSPEKGLETLLTAWRHLPPDTRLKIVGDGPLASVVQKAAEEDPRIEWLGRQPPAEVLRSMADAALLVFPSQWFEGLPRTIIESFAVGTPVVAADLGAMAELVADGQNGLKFETGDARQLAAALQRWRAAPPEWQAALRDGARRAYESHFTAEPNYDQLMQIYAQAAEQFRRASSGHGGPPSANPSTRPHPPASSALAPTRLGE